MEGGTVLKKLKVMSRSFAVEVVSATPEMAAKIAEVELKAWGDPRYIPPVEVYEERIHAFPKGVVVACYQGEIVGCVMYMRVPRVQWVLDRQDFHTIVRHFGDFPEGNTAFGVTWSVLPCGSAVGATAALEVELFTRCFLSDNVEDFVLGGRPVNFCTLNRKLEEKGKKPVSVHRYVTLTRLEVAFLLGKPVPDGSTASKLYDPELRLYVDTLGFDIVDMKDGYMPEDSSVSGGWGVMLVRRNPFYKKPSLRSLARSIAPVVSRFMV
jgi:hypothetical protein